MEEREVERQRAESKRILLVEDDELFRRSLLSYLGLLGYEAVIAGSAEEALEMQRRESVDLVLTDFHLLRMNGIDLIRALRSAGCLIPAILISGFLSEEIRQMASDAHIEAVLRKPSDLPKLQDLLPGLLGAVP